MKTTTAFLTAFFVGTFLSSGALVPAAMADSALNDANPAQMSPQEFSDYLDAVVAEGDGAGNGDGNVYPGGLGDPPLSDQEVTRGRQHSEWVLDDLNGRTSLDFEDWLEDRWRAGGDAPYWYEEGGTYVDENGDEYVTPDQEWDQAQIDIERQEAELRERWEDSGSSQSYSDWLMEQFDGYDGRHGGDDDDWDDVNKDGQLPLDIQWRDRLIVLLEWLESMEAVEEEETDTADADTAAPTDADVGGLTEEEIEILEAEERQSAEEDSGEDSAWMDELENMQASLMPGGDDVVVAESADATGLFPPFLAHANTGGPDIAMMAAMRDTMTAGALPDLHRPDAHAVAPPVEVARHPVPGAITLSIPSRSSLPYTD